jgi:putative hemolysin
MNPHSGIILTQRRIACQRPVLLLIALLALAGCTQPAQEVQEAQLAPSATPGVRATDKALAARRAVVDFLRTGATICVPPAGATWQTSSGVAPQGFEVYLFQSDDCFMTVANPLPATDDTLYHVALHNSVIGFCWQAHVDADGQVVATGTRAEIPQPLADAAAAHCVEQGYEHEVKEQADGTRCGVCTFTDGRSCKSWTYFQGMCE